MARRYAVILSILIAAAVGAPTIYAQGACPGVECPYTTPTSTAPAPSPTPTPTGTRTPDSPTATPEFQATSTPVPMPQAQEFPIPNYKVPTSIPTPSLSNVPNPIELSMSTPLPLDTPQPWTPGEYSMSPSESFSVSFGANFPAPGSVLTYSPTISGLGGSISGTLGSGEGLTGDIISYTSWLSGEITALEGRETFTLSAAPAWYAPQLPRDIANVGWTFELLNTEAGNRYTMQTWAAMFGSIVAMPIKLSLNIWELFRFFGPFGLFVIWLLTMAVLVFNLNVLNLLLKSAKTMYEFVLSTIAVLSNLLQWLWSFFLWVMDWTWTIVNWILDWIYKILNLIGNYLPFT